MSLMRTLFDLGGTAVNYVRATGLTMTNGKVDGVTATDALGDAVFTLRARCVINATGVWVDAVRRMEDKNAPTMVAPSQGVHLTAARFPAGQARHPDSQDRRRPRAVRGAVERPHHRRHHRHPRDDLPLDPDAGAQDVDFILGTARYLSRKPTRDDVTSVWAGLRPWSRPPARRHQDAVARTHHPGVQGRPGHGHGRKMDHLPPHGAGRGQHGHPEPAADSGPCRTESLALHGAAGLSPSQEHAGTPDSYYGSDLPALKALPGRAHAGQRQRPVRSPCALRRPLRAGAHAETCWRVATAPCSWIARPPCWRRRKSPVSWPRNSATTPPGSSALRDLEPVAARYRLR